MVRIFQTRDDYQHGHLVVEQEPKASRVNVFYIPSQRKLEEAQESTDNTPPYRTKLLELDQNTGNITIFPINTLGRHHRFLKPKYGQIERITLAEAHLLIAPSNEFSPSDHNYLRSLIFSPTEPVNEDIEEDTIAPFSVTSDDIMEILEELPRGFIKDYDYGLGLAKPYRFIITAIEALSDSRQLIVSQNHETGVDNTNNIFYISTDDFETLRKLMDSTNRLSLAASTSVKDAESHNFLANKIGKPTKPISVGRHRYRKLLTTEIQSGDRPLSDKERDDFLEVISRNMKSIVETSPQKLATLRNDIELVNLKSLIERYESMLSQNHSEQVWQKFLNGNPFILGLAFGYPIIKIQDQASMGGRNFSKRGERIADFLVKNSMTNNTAIVEIKTPNSKLLNDRKFRDQVYTPSSTLSGSITQALDQKYHFEREIIQLRDRSKMYDIQSYSVHCCLIIGSIPNDEDRLKSFEMFRGNLSGVEIVTFDELLQKLKNLHEFLEMSDVDDSGEIGDG